MTLTQPFQDCDDEYIRRALDENYPPDFTPIWATDNISEVTTDLKTNISDFYDKYQEIVTGTEISGSVPIF